MIFPDYACEHFQREIVLTANSLAAHVTRSVLLRKTWLNLRQEGKTLTLTILSTMEWYELPNASSHKALICLDAVLVTRQLLSSERPERMPMKTGN